MNKILFVGWTGYICSHMAWLLSQKGVVVVNLGNLNNLAYTLELLKAMRIQGLESKILTVWQ